MTRRCRCHFDPIYQTLVECPRCHHWSLDEGVGCERRACGFEVPGRNPRFRVRALGDYFGVPHRPDGRPDPERLMTLMDPPDVEDPTDEKLVADLRRFAASSDEVIARHAQKRLAKMGLA